MIISELIFVIMFLAQALNTIEDVFPCCAFVCVGTISI